MGAWSHGSFGNDDALDWVGELAETETLGPITKVLDVVTNAEGEYLEAPDASMALAAAEVVAALIGQPAEILPEEVSEWVKGKKPPPKTIVAQAQTVVLRILKDSELKELWDESDDAALWQSEVSGLQKRLCC